MSKTLIRYQGFQANTMDREYTFAVQHASEEPREYTLVIAQDAFGRRRIRFQDAPEICLLRLNRELAASEADPLKAPAESHFRISEAEFDEYREAHSPKHRRSFYSRKPAVGG